MRVTDHGEGRIRKRIGINKKAVNRMAGIAMERGLKHCETSGRLHKYYSHLYFRNETANNIRIYANFVWIFCGEHLATVFPVPHKYQKAVLKLLKNK